MTANEFRLSDPVARLVAADAEQEQGREANAAFLRVKFELTGNGERTLTETGARWTAPRQALESLQRGDWVAFLKTYHRSGRIKIQMSRHNFDGTPLTEVCVGISCLNRSLGHLQLPGNDPGDKWIGMAVLSALALVGLTLDAKAGVKS